MFFKFSTKGNIAVLIVYVNDIILTVDDLVEMNKLKQCLGFEFEIKDLGILRFFLGMEVACSKNGIVMSQRKYILDLLNEIGMSGCKPLDAFMSKAHKKSWKVVSLCIFWMVWKEKKMLVFDNAEFSV